MKRTSLIFAFFFLFSLSFFPAEAAEPVSGFRVVSLKAGKALIKAEVAETEEERTRGLMFRKRLDKNSGMLFDFGAPAKVCMWMKNTYIPLSVAFIDQDGFIVNIEDMKPLTTDSHCSNGWVRYALEMNRGWFAARKIVQGNQIEGIP